MNNDSKKYLKEVKLLIPLNTKEKKKFIDLLKQQIQSVGIVNYEELIDQFGSPKEVAASFIENTDTTLLIKKLKKKNYIKTIVTVIIVCLLVVSFFEIYRLNQLYEEAKTNIHGYYEEEIEDYGVKKSNIEK